MAKYYYHPLGEYAENYINDVANTSERPHTRNGHGWGKIDWGVGGGHPVYAMTDGTLSSVNCRNASGEGGYVVILRTDRVDGTGKPIYINYLELDGLGEIPAQIAGIKAGPNTYNGQYFTYNANHTPVSMGTLLGYTNSRFTGSNIHLDFTYGDRYAGATTEGESHVSFNSKDGVPHIQDVSQLVNSFQVSGKTVSCNGTILGTEQGYAKNSGGGATNYPVLDSLSYLICFQKPIKVTGNNVTGASALIDRSKYVPANNENQSGVNFYYTGTISQNFAGPYPESISILQSEACKPLRRIARNCKGEFGSFGNAGAASYAKLWRANIIGAGRGSFSGQKDCTNIKDWVDVALSSGWMAPETRYSDWSCNESDLPYVQAVYKNLCYPDIYGLDLGLGNAKNPEYFKQKIIEAASIIPVGNNSNYGNKNDLVARVSYNPKTDQDNVKSDYGIYILYRQENDGMKYFNTSVQ